MSDKIGLFTGSFDPITNGHLELIERASKLFDKLYVGIFYNPHKTGFLSIKKVEKKTVEKAVAHLDNIEVLASHDELVVDVARRLGVHVLVSLGYVTLGIYSMKQVLTITIISWQEKLRQSTSTVD